jgi:proliferating cell nuclear antigen
MFEALLTQGSLLKNVLEAIKELVTEANLDCSTSGCQLQAMDSSHVALVYLMLRESGFENFRCDRSQSLGINMASMSKMLKCSGKDDSITMRCEEGADTLTFLFETPAKDRVSEFQLKLMDIEGESLGIPDQDYTCVVEMPASEYARICRDLSALGDTVTIDVKKEAVTFTTSGDIGKGSVSLKPTTSVDKPEEKTTIECKDHTNLKFALKYLAHFAKAAPLSTAVKLSIARDVPLMVEYKIGEMGYIRYFLAPKIDEDEDAT